MRKSPSTVSYMRGDFTCLIFHPSLSRFFLSLDSESPCRFPLGTYYEPSNGSLSVQIRPRPPPSKPSTPGSQVSYEHSQTVYGDHP